MAYGTVKGYCVEESCGHNPGMFNCKWCGAILCQLHFQEGHVCAKAAAPVAPMTLDLEEKVETGYKTKVEEPEIRRKKRG